MAAFERPRPWPSGADPARPDRVFKSVELVEMMSADGIRRYGRYAVEVKEWIDGRLFVGLCPVPEMEVGLSFGPERINGRHTSGLFGGMDE